MRSNHDAAPKISTASDWLPRRRRSRRSAEHQDSSDRRERFRCQRHASRRINGEDHQRRAAREWQQSYRVSWLNSECGKRNGQRKQLAWMRTIGGWTQLCRWDEDWERTGDLQHDVVGEELRCRHRTQRRSRAVQNAHGDESSVSIVQTSCGEACSSAGMVPGPGPVEGTGTGYFECSQLVHPISILTWLRVV